MPSHTDHHTLPYTPEQLFALVADVERYPEFLPWCRAARILSHELDGFTAELVIAFRGFTESYVSRVTLRPPESIEAKLVRGPFAHLENRWKFLPAPNGGTDVEFFLDFQFRSRMLELLIGGLFHKAARKMAEAFRSRAGALYGAPASAKVD